MTTFSASDYAYLDYAATAPLCEEAELAMRPYVAAGRRNLAFGANANSLHSPGRAAFEELERARKTIAAALGARRPSEIVFTSGATEADNAALFGLAHGALDQRRRSGRPVASPVVITTAIEHDAVLAPAKRLEASGFTVVRLAPDAEGFISPQALEAALTPDVVLVSVQAANSEVGSIQPIAQLAKASHRAGALFHTDATQALGKIACNVEEWQCDAASFSAHKIGGPKGVGALYMRSRTPFSPVLLGGGQEQGLRSGTQNVCGIVGFAAACAAACSLQEQERDRLSALRDRAYRELCAFPGVRATVPVTPNSRRYLPNIVHVIVDGLESETMILRMDMRGVGVSGGSACSSHSLSASHVLKAMGISDDDAHCALRVSMGRYTEQRDIDALIEAMGACLDWE